MTTTRSRKEVWPRKITLGRISVTIYKRTMPNGSAGFMVANYSGEKRRFDSYATEADALDAANKLARQLSQRDVLGANMTKEQSIEYASAVQTLEPLGISLTSAVSTLVESVKLVGDLSGVTAAAKFYKARNKTVTPKRVADVVAASTSRRRPGVLLVLLQPTNECKYQHGDEEGHEKHDIAWVIHIHTGDFSISQFARRV